MAGLVFDQPVLMKWEKRDRWGRLVGVVYVKGKDAGLGAMLISGVRSVIRHIRRRLQAGQPVGNPWVEALLQRCHVNGAAAALANKMARIAWVLLARKEHYQPLSARA